MIPIIPVIGAKVLSGVSHAAWLAAIYGVVKSGFDFVVKYWHSVKMAFLILFFIAVIRFANGIVVTVWNTFNNFSSTVSGVQVNASGYTEGISYLSQVNSVFPVSETLVLLSSLSALWVSANLLRWVIAIWKSIPFKSS